MARKFLVTAALVLFSFSFLPYEHPFKSGEGKLRVHFFSRIITASSCFGDDGETILHAEKSIKNAAQPWRLIIKMKSLQLVCEHWELLRERSHRQKSPRRWHKEVFSVSDRDSFRAVFHVSPRCGAVWMRPKLFFFVSLPPPPRCETVTLFSIFVGWHSEIMRGSKPRRPQVLVAFFLPLWQVVKLIDLRVNIGAHWEEEPTISLRMIFVVTDFSRKSLPPRPGRSGMTPRSRCRR